MEHEECQGKGKWVALRGFKYPDQLEYSCLDCSRFVLGYKSGSSKVHVNLNKKVTTK